MGESYDGIYALVDLFRIIKIPNSLPRRGCCRGVRRRASSIRRRKRARRFLESEDPASKDEERGAMLTLGNSSSSTQLARASADNVLGRILWRQNVW